MNPNRSAFVGTLFDPAPLAPPPGWSSLNRRAPFGPLRHKPPGPPNTTVISGDRWGSSRERHDAGVLAGRGHRVAQPVEESARAGHRPDVELRLDLIV